MFCIYDVIKRKKEKIDEVLVEISIIIVEIKSRKVEGSILEIFQKELEKVKVWVNIEEQLENLRIGLVFLI